MHGGTESFRIILAYVRLGIVCVILVIFPSHEYKLHTPYVCMRVYALRSSRASQRDLGQRESERARPRSTLRDRLAESFVGLSQYTQWIKRCFNYFAVGMGSAWVQHRTPSKGKHTSACKVFMSPGPLKYNYMLATWLAVSQKWLWTIIRMSWIKCCKIFS